MWIWPQTSRLQGSSCLHGGNLASAVGRLGMPTVRFHCNFSCSTTIHSWKWPTRSLDGDWMTCIYRNILAFNPSDCTVLSEFYIRRYTVEFRAEGLGVVVATIVVGHRYGWNTEKLYSHSPCSYTNSEWRSIWSWHVYQLNDGKKLVLWGTMQCLIRRGRTVIDRNHFARRFSL